MFRLVIPLLLLTSFATHAQTFRWYKAQLHCHSTNSDGHLSPDSVLEFYKKRGIAVVAITDHSYITPTTEQSTDSFLTLPGVERAWYGGDPPMVHTNQIGAETPSMIEQVNHPARPQTPLTWVQALCWANKREAILIEVNRPEDAAIWDSILTSGRKIFGTCSDDNHDYVSSHGFVMICSSSLDTGGIYSALRRGDFYASRGPLIDSVIVAGRTVSVYSLQAADITFIGRGGVTLKTVPGTSASFTQGDMSKNAYVRAVVKNDMGALAYTQPVFSTPQAGRARPMVVLWRPEPHSTSNHAALPPARENCVGVEIFSSTGRLVGRVFDVAAPRHSGPKWAVRRPACTSWISAAGMVDDSPTNR